MRISVLLMLAVLAPLLGCVRQAAEQSKAGGDEPSSGASHSVEPDVAVDEAVDDRAGGLGKGDGANLPERPAGCCAQISPVPFSPLPTAPIRGAGDRPPPAVDVALADGADRNVGLIASDDLIELGTTAARDNPADRDHLWTRADGGDWPTFLGPTGDSVSPEKGILKRWPAAGPRIVWQRVLGEGYGIGSISKGRLFQLDRHRDRARLSCINAETGRTLWVFQYETNYRDLYNYNGGPRCSPVVDGDRVYIYGVEGMLHCLQATDGKLIWKADVNGQFGVVQNFFGVGSTPAVEGDLLIVMVGGSPAESQAVAPGQLDRVVGNGSGVVAFDKRTGQVRYKLSDELASYASIKLATIGQRRWGFAFARGGLVGFEPGSGKVDFHYRWRSALVESVNASTPVVVGDRVFISETYSVGSSLLQVRPGGAKVVWSDDPRRRDKAMKAHWNTPIYDGGYLYGCSGRNTNDADLRCIDFKTGEVKWRQPGITRCSLLKVDGHFVCLAEYGMLYLLRANPRKFDLVAATTLLEPPAGPQRPADELPTRLQYPCWSAPVLSHGLLYVRGARRLVCLELIPQRP